MVSSIISPRRRSNPQRPAQGLSDTETSASGSVSGTRTLSFPHVVDMFVKLRRLQKSAKLHHIDSSSGPDPITHADLSPGGDDATPKRRARMEVEDSFVCADGVDVVKLLRASRAVLLERAAMLHANALVDET